MGYERETLNQWFNLGPDIGKEWGCVGIFVCQPMYSRVPIIIVVRFGLNERIVGVDHFTTTYDYHTYRAYTRRFVVSSFEVDGSKVLHNLYQITPRVSVSVV